MTTYINYNVTGDERKRLIKAISNFNGADIQYLGAPTFAYKVGGYTIDKTGCVSFDDDGDRENIECLILTLAEQGFVTQASNLGCEDSETTDEQVADPAAESDGLTVSMPMDGFDPDSLDRLTKLVDSKAALIQKALGAARLTIKTDDDHVSFPWWDRMPDPEETQAYLSFIAELCAMAKQAKRVTATEKEVESEKYAFRCFLLRLGFVGSESKAQRKILMRRLSGSSAFPNKEAAEAFSAAQKIKRDAAKAAEEVTSNEASA